VRIQLPLKLQSLHDSLGIRLGLRKSRAILARVKVIWQEAETIYML
jgi:hypothetical protein